MGSRYLTDLADAVRATGLVVQEEGGWQTRARGSGGYNSGLPNHVMIHHTASGSSSDGQPDVNYCCYGSADKPLANLYLSRAGKVWIMAGGATNTNGSGSDPCGAIANDSMNSSAIGIEAGNNGTGEPWPQAQQDAYTKLVKALCDHYGIPVGRVHSHAEWAPSRKIDPAGPSKWASSGTWNEDAFRSDVAAGGGGPTPPPTKRKWLAMYGLYVSQEDGAVFASDMIHVRWLRTNRAVQHYQAMLTVFGFNPNATSVPRQEVIDGVYGTPIDWQPWGQTGEGDRVWNELVAAGGWPTGSAWQYLVDGRVSANEAAAYAKQAADNTAGGGGSAPPVTPADFPPPKSVSFEWDAADVPTLPADQIEDAPAKGRREK